MTNIAVVVLDTLRKDAFNRHFDWLPGRRFENAWSPSHWTVPAHGAMFTGRYPSEVNVRAKAEQLDCDQPVLAEKMRDAGYTTRAFSANPYVSPVFNYDRGFTNFSGSWRLRQLDPSLFDWTEFVSETRNDGMIRYAKALYRCLRGGCRTIPSLKQGVRLKLRQWNFLDRIDDDGGLEALEYIRGTDFSENEFLYVNLMEAHTPYDPPEEYRTVDVTHGLGLRETIKEDGEATVDTESVREAYDNCVRYLSDVYADIFDELTTDFDYIITVSDHGELLGEHGGWAHGYGLYPELTHVPLSVCGPGFKDGKDERLTSLIDIYTTVLDIADVGADSRGKSLLSDEVADGYLTEYHGLTQRRLDKLRDSGLSEDRINKYDQTLRGLVLPDYYGFETPSGFVNSKGEPRSGAEEQLRGYVEALDITRRSAEGKDDLSEDVVSQLEDLGYA